MSRATRRTYTNGAVRFLIWQMSYHVEHHAFPSVPFHALPVVNALSRDRFAVTAPGELALQRGFVRKYRALKAVRHGKTTEGCRHPSRSIDSRRFGVNACLTDANFLFQAE
jgi:fatty acid desaturase